MAEGENISQGQRQLLSIARAFLAQPKICLLYTSGAGFDDTDPRNAYGPYFQRQRVEIYQDVYKRQV